jgi:hypothetical protein
MLPEHGCARRDNSRDGRHTKLSLSWEIGGGEAQGRTWLRRLTSLKHQPPQVARLLRACFDAPRKAFELEEMSHLLEANHSVFFFLVL